MFGYTGLDSDSGAAGVIRNVGLIDVNVSGKLDVGGLVGQNRGVISSSYVTGLVSGGDLVGGLVGRNYEAITGSHVTGCVSESLPAERNLVPFLARVVGDRSVPLNPKALIRAGSVNLQIVDQENAFSRLHDDTAQLYRTERPNV